MRPADKEAINDRAKLMMHRLIARRLAHDPHVLAGAKAAVLHLASRYPDHSFPKEWASILDLPPKTIRRQLTSRAETMRRLRLSSPFVAGGDVDDLQNPDLRRRIWRLARKSAVLHDGTPPGSA